MSICLASRVCGFINCRVSQKLRVSDPKFISIGRIQTQNTYRERERVENKVGQQ